MHVLNRDRLSIPLFRPPAVYECNLFWNRFAALSATYPADLLKTLDTPLHSNRETAPCPHLDPDDFSTTLRHHKLRLFFSLTQTSQFCVIKPRFTPVRSTK